LEQSNRCHEADILLFLLNAARRSHLEAARELPEPELGSQTITFMLLITVKQLASHSLLKLLNITGCYNDIFISQKTIKEMIYRKNKLLSNVIFLEVILLMPCSSLHSNNNNNNNNNSMYNYSILLYTCVSSAALHLLYTSGYNY